MKQSVKKGEEVVVISGSAKGKRGKVLAVMPSESRVIVEGVNIRKFHERKSQKNRALRLQEVQGVSGDQNTAKNEHTST